VCKVEEGVEEWQELVAQEQCLPHGFHCSLTPHRWILILGNGNKTHVAMGKYQIAVRNA